MLHHCAMCFLGVAAASCLIVTNKLLLQRLPSRYAPEALTMMHNFISLATTRLCCPKVDRGKRVGVHWLLATGLIAMLSVLSSNWTLQHASVAFQQLARTATVPAGAALDYVNHRKLISGSQVEDLVLLIGGLCVAITGDVTTSPLGALFAAISCASALGANLIVRHVSTESALRPVEMMYHVAPWTLASTACVLASKIGAHHQSGAPLVSVSSLSAIQPLSIDPRLAALMFVNGGLSLGVQYLATWAQTHCSYTGYAVLNQAKTGGAVMLSAIVLAPVTGRTCGGLSVTLAAACAFTLADRPGQSGGVRDGTSPTPTPPTPNGIQQTWQSRRPAALGWASVQTVQPYARKLATVSMLALLLSPQAGMTSIISFSRGGEVDKEVDTSSAHARQRPPQRAIDIQANRSSAPRQRHGGKREPAATRAPPLGQHVDGKRARRRVSQSQ